MKFISESDGVRVEVDVKSPVLDDVIAAFKDFLLGCGYPAALVKEQFPEDV